jgi:hypothetical protein
MVDLFVTACEPLGIDLHYAVLRAPLPVVLSRVQSRTIEPEHRGALADESVVDDLWTQFERHGVAARHCVDAGDQSPDVIADEICRRWETGQFRLLAD